MREGKGERAPLPAGALIREATAQDLETVLHHRRRMCEDMGHREAAVLDRMVADCRGQLRRWLEEGVYRNVTLDASDDGRALYESMGFRPTPQMRLDLTR